MREGRLSNRKGEPSCIELDRHWTSCFAGVQVCGSGTTLWRTRMTLPGLRSRHINLGQFAVAEEAARAYDRYVWPAAVRTEPKQKQTIMQ
mgnify:CR=1 FL=1